MPGSKDALLTANTQSAVHADAGLLTILEFVCRTEPYLFDVMLDPKQALIDDNKRGIELATKWGTPKGTVIDKTLDHEGIPFAALPVHVWEAIYPDF